MKKMISLLVVLLLASSFVLAQGQGIHEPGTGMEDPELKEAGQGTGQGLADSAGVTEDVDSEDVIDGETVGSGQQNGNQGTGSPKGLENAMQKVKNENALQQLEQNMEQFQEMYQERFANYEEDVEVVEVDEETGAVTLEAKEQVKFLGFIKGKAMKRYMIDAEGNVEEQHPWYRFMYTEMYAEQEGLESSD